MKLTLALTLLIVASTFAWRLPGIKRNFIRVLQDETSETSEPLPNIDFTGDWEENVHGELGVGRSFQINYDGSRLPGRTTMYGNPAWSIDVEYKFDDDEDFKSEQLGPPQPSGNIFKKEILIPINATKVEMYFKHWDYYNQDTYDSDYGKNYNFDITKPSIVFDKDWNENVHGELVPGGDFDLFYDSLRLAEGAQVQAQMKFVGDTVATKALDVAGEGSSYQTSVISIPDDAEKLVMWFYYEDADGNKHWDSDYGNNYNFDLSEE